MRRKISVTLSDKIEEFLSDKRVEGISEKTIKTYVGHLNNVLRNYKDCEFDSINWDEVVTNLYKRDLSDYSKVSLLRTLRCFMHHFDIPVNFKIHKVETVKETYTAEELKKLTRKPKDANFADFRTYAIILLALDTGLRSASIRNIKVDDIQDDSVIIRQSKTNKVAILPFSKTTASAIKVLKRNIGNAEYLFCGIDNQKLSESALRSSLERYCKKRGVEHHSMHMFRHTFAKNWVKNGGNPYVLQKMLMHSTMDMTRQYLNLFDNDIKDLYISAVESLSTEKIKYKIH